MRGLLVLVCSAVLSLAASGADEGLKPLTGALVPLRTMHVSGEERDAGPELTPVKHLFREWVESRLPAEPYDPNDPADLDALTLHLNAALAAAGLYCDGKNPADKICEAQNPAIAMQPTYRGYIGGVALSYLEDGRYLLVKTNVGIECGFDESAYVYVQRDGHWRLLFETEQDDYAEKVYAPQNFLAISASPANVAWNEQAPPPLVLTLGFSPWCTSNWQALYTRLWRAAPSDTRPKPLLDTSDTLFRGDYGVAAGSLTDHDVVIEYRGRSQDGDTLIRPHVVHYLVTDKDELRRIAPVALRPNDFVDEWLTRPWSESVQWTDGGKRVAKALYDRLHAQTDYLFGLTAPVTRCLRKPTLWQVGFAPMRDGKFGDEVYFLVRWMAPYRFSVAGVRHRVYPGCGEKVAMPDNLGTLFPLQDWRH